MPTTETNSNNQNRILAALPAVEYARLANSLEIVTLSAGQVLYEPGDRLAHVYFPTTSIVSLIHTTESGASAELAMTGNDGLIGIPLVMGGESTTLKVLVQSAGSAYRLRAEVMSWEIDQGGALHRLCLRYIQALLTQIAQSVICNRHHAIDQQLCRWLLLSLDRLPDDRLDVTHEQIAHMLGVRRESVTEAAGKLQAAGLIHYRRGRIEVTDRPGLEARVCECYKVVKSECDRLLQPVPATAAKHRPRPNPASLRKRAEARFQQQALSPPADASWNAERLLHELQVHQIELEIQNEELRLAYDEADASREKYADLYDFAPVGYFTLDEMGVIVQLNLAGAILLGIKRSESARYRFAAYVEQEYLAVFNRFHDEVLGGQSGAHCEIVLTATDRRPEATVRIEAVRDESGHECRMVVMDITAEKVADGGHRQRPTVGHSPLA